MGEIDEGTPLWITDAAGDEHEAVALKAPEKGHKFPIVWVYRAEGMGSGAPFDPVPWPLESVRLRALPNEKKEQGT